MTHPTTELIAYVTQSLGPAERAAIETQTPIVYQDWALDDGGDVTLGDAATRASSVHLGQVDAVLGGKLPGQR